MHFVTWFLKDMGSMGSSAAKEIDDSRMKRRMILVKEVALMIRWQSFRNLKGLKDILLKMTILKELVKCLQQAGIATYILYIWKTTSNHMPQPTFILYIITTLSLLSTPTITIVILVLRSKDKK